MKKVLIPALMAFSIMAASCNEEKKTDETSVTTEQNTQDSTGANTANNTLDTDFAMKAADGGMLEVKLGELAQEKGSSAKIKELGKMMVADHSKANDELITWAMKNSITLPQELGQENQNKYNELAAKKGADFDKAYAELLVGAHEKSIALFKSEADGGSNAELKSWAAAKLPTLEHHLQMVRSTNDALKK